jgi:putative endonuclease
MPLLAQIVYEALIRRERKRARLSSAARMPQPENMVAWDGPVLAFVEVKTRISREAGPPEAAVTFDQQKRIAAAAQIYLQGLKQKAVNYRFDIVSVAWDQTEGYQLRLIKSAFKR